MATLRRYQVSVKDDYEGKYTTTIVALSAGRAKYEYWLDARDAWPDFQWGQLRCRSLGIAFPQSVEIIDADDRRKLAIMRHALGLDHLGLNKQGGTEGYRNHYALYRTSDDYGYLMSLCDSNGRLPLMGHNSADALAKDMVYFHVTITGADFVKRHTGVNHSKD